MSPQDRLDAVNVSKAVDYILSCMNFDGGFGRIPGSESHAGQVRWGYYAGHNFGIIVGYKHKGKPGNNNHQFYKHKFLFATTASHDLISNATW